MEEFKKDNFRRDYPELQFPQIEALSPEQCRLIAREIAQWVGSDLTVDNLALVHAIAQQQEHVTSILGNHNFNLAVLLNDLGITPSDEVFINWYRFDMIDRMASTDICCWFEYIWYPDSDDIDIFDDSLTWILSVSHSGGVGLLRR